jgi:hypothetical protein
MSYRLGRTEDDAEVKKAVNEAQEYYNAQDRRDWVKWAAKEAELNEKEVEYIRQVNVKEIDEVRFRELVSELDLERAIGESIVEGPATTQDEEVGESEWDESAEKVVESSTVGKGKRKAAPARAKVYGEVDGLVSHLPKSSSICANIYAYSATDVSRGRCS